MPFAKLNVHSIALFSEVDPLFAEVEPKVLGIRCTGVVGYAGFTPAYLKEAFLSAALQLAQSGQSALDEEFAKAVLGQVEQLREHITKMKSPERLSSMEPPAGRVGFGA